MSIFDGICDLCGEKIDKEGSCLLTDKWSPSGARSSVNVATCSKHSKEEVDEYIKKAYEENPGRDDDIGMVKELAKKYKRDTK